MPQSEPTPLKQFEEGVEEAKPGPIASIYHPYVSDVLRPHRNQRPSGRRACQWVEVNKKPRRSTGTLGENILSIEMDEAQLLVPLRIYS